MVAQLNPLFMPAPSLQEGFIDKNTGLPLANGLVYFYSDNDRVTLKPIYEIQEPSAGSPITYVALPNPVILSIVGTIQDNNGNDVIPYFCPYDAAGAIELYYIICTDQYGVQQFTRVAFPNISAGTTNTTVNLTNYVPNGQFLIHNSSYPNTPASTFNYGGGTTTATQLVCPSGWTWEVSTGSTAIDQITFDRLSQYIGVPSASPRYLIDINRTTPSADAIADLRIRFNDVHKFSTNTSFTFSFTAKSLSGTNISINAIEIDYFGTSPTTGTIPNATVQTIIGGPQLITTAFTTVLVPITFNLSSGKNVGDNDDDFVQIAIRFPTSNNQLFHVQLTDFILTPGALTNTVNFPVTTNGEFMLGALSNLAPTTTDTDDTQNYYSQDGSNLYLPIVMTANGFTYDYSKIGKVEANTTLNDFTGSISNISNELLCDGAQYKTSSYSPLGIPYLRLQKKLFNATANAPAFGTGVNWDNVYISTTAPNDQLIFCTNKINSPQTVPADGVAGKTTGFTFGASSNVGTAGHNYRAYTNTNAYITFISTFINGTHLNNGVVAGTSGMVVADYVYRAITDSYFIFNVTALSAATLSTGIGVPAKYFTFSDHTVDYYLWFNVAGETDPAPGGTGIQCHLVATASAIDVANIIANVITGTQTDIVTVTGQPTDGAGAYFTFNANAVQTAVWYKITGAGAAPAGFTSTVQVTLTGLETAAQIAALTQTAINSAYFAVPDYRGVFLRGLDTLTYNFDLDIQKRYGYVSSLTPQSVGSFELSQITNHQHTVNLSATGGGNEQGGTNGTVNTGFVSPTGSTETRPVNSFVAYVIKY